MKISRRTVTGWALQENDEAKALLIDAIKHDNITSDQIEAEDETDITIKLIPCPECGSTVVHTHQ